MTSCPRPCPVYYKHVYITRLIVSIMGLFSETGKLLQGDHCEVNQKMGVSRLSRDSRTIYFCKFIPII